MKTPCWSCEGRGHFFEHGECGTCEGTGFLNEPRLHVMSRRKHFVGSRDPRSDAHGNEKWPRLTTEVPPEIAEELDRIGKLVNRRHGLGSVPKRASIVRHALLEWMEKYDPEPGPAIEATAEEIIERLELESTAEEEPT